jgi:PhzF family phenazine biosynthesis protein
MTMGQPVVQVDAFTDRPFAGNPAAVCVLEAAAEESWMQYVAREMNLSETAFLYPEEGDYRLRWFTPSVEVELCGHATLASAHVLWESEMLKPADAARFRTRSGVLVAKRHDEWIEMDFPATPPVAETAADGLLESLGVKALWVGRSKFDYLVEVASEEEVRQVAPDFGALAEVEVRGVIVTARSEAPDSHFVSRFFAPAAGVNEDPVTGSAHCCLAAFWAERLGLREMEARQLSLRGGRVRVRFEGERVKLFGQAITVMTGELLWPPDSFRGDSQSFWND